MIRTCGFTHLGLAVRDLDASLRFYERVFGVRVLYRDGTEVQVQTPSAHDVIAFQKRPRKAGRQGGVSHFGFRLVDPKDVEAAAREAEAAGGRILRRGEFVPGEPYVFVADPDGYEVEIWFE